VPGVPENGIQFQFVPLAFVFVWWSLFPFVCFLFVVSLADSVCNNLWDFYLRNALAEHLPFPIKNEDENLSLLD
jgi:hypothetical protein